MRKSFFAGLVTLLPVLITYIVLAFGIRLITAPFEYIVSLLLFKLHLLDDGLGMFTHEELISVVSKILIVTFLVGTIFLVGFIASRLAILPVGYYVDELLMKTPLVRAIYGPSKELVNLFFVQQDTGNRQPVLVPYTSPTELTLGLITKEFTAKLHDKEIDYVSVFIPSTPNPTGGYLCTYEKASVVLLDLPADVALKSVMSFTIVRKE